MNEKDKEMHRIIDAVIECCTTTLGEDVYSVNKEDVLGKCKRENANITRSMIVYHLSAFGLSHATISMLFNRTEQSVRNMIEAHHDMIRTNRAYRIANTQAESKINARNEQEI